MRVKMKRKKGGRPASPVPMASFQVRIPEPLYDALTRYCVTTSRTKAAGLRIALERYLGEEGFYEPTNGKDNANHPT